MSFVSTARSPGFCTFVFSPDRRRQLTCANSLFESSRNEFSRIESLLAPPSISLPSSNSPSRHSSSHQELPVLLSSLFQKLSTDLSSLLLILDRAIPLADRASDLGGKLFAELYSQGSNLQRNKEQKEDWRIYLPSLGSNWESKAIKRDLNVMEIGVENVKNLRYNLELTRINLMSYSNNVGHFKVGFLSPSLISIASNINGIL